MNAPALRAKILVVEDDVALRNLYKYSLTVEGFAVDAVGDGVDALRSIDQSLPDLIVLDLILPRFDGIFVQQEISARASTRAIPVVVVTGEDRDIDERRNVCVLRKPVDVGMLVAKIHECLAKTHRRVSVERRRDTADGYWRASAAERPARRRRP
jgi:two-component system, OmpR family, phosphate regulon response regulator PhoB